jgi:catechol 2,3-dioxygenase-like lactoylglutathione lyase family enzyme
MASTKQTLHSHLNRISRWDLNVTDLERSKTWYEGTTTLRAVARTSANQSFPSLGIQEGAFDGRHLSHAFKAERNGFKPLLD